MRLKSRLQSASKQRCEEQIERTDELIRLTYELPEEDPERPKPIYKSISGHAFAADGHLQISAYFDTPEAPYDWLSGHPLRPKCRLTPPSSGRPRASFAVSRSPLMSNVRAKSAL